LSEWPEIVSVPYHIIKPSNSTQYHVYFC